MKPLLLGGAGKIGSVAAWELTMDPGVECVGVAGRSIKSLDRARSWIGTDKVRTHLLDISETSAARRLMSGYDIVIITLPDRRNSYLAMELAIDSGLSVVDVLEEYHRRPEPHETEGLPVPTGVSLDDYGEALHRKALDCGVTVLDGMGFAPGLSNVTTGHGISLMDKATSATARVGGIPSKESAARHSLKYMITWSFGHVLREYSVPVRVLRDGRAAWIKATSERERFRYREFGIDEELECAVTPGMPSFIYTRPDLREFSEKTVRWPGHWDGIDLLRDCGLLSLDPVEIAGTKVVPREFFAALMEPRLRPLPEDSDIAVMWNTVLGGKEGAPARWDCYMWSVSDPVNKISAMARVTGFSAAIGARMISRGIIREHGIVAPEDGVVGDAYSSYIGELHRRGIDVIERFSSVG